jgi:hypothetical protein
MPCCQVFPLHKTHVAGIPASMASITENVKPAVLAGVPAAFFCIVNASPGPPVRALYTLLDF